MHQQQRTSHSGSPLVSLTSPVRVRRDQREGTSPALVWPLDTADGVTRLLQAPATMRCYGHYVANRDAWLCSALFTVYVLRSALITVRRDTNNTATASFVLVPRCLRTFAKCQKLVRHCARIPILRKNTSSVVYPARCTYLSPVHNLLSASPHRSSVSVRGALRIYS
jgi:hypothetical protein